MLRDTACHPWSTLDMPPLMLRVTWTEDAALVLTACSGTAGKQLCRNILESSKERASAEGQ